MNPLVEQMRPLTDTIKNDIREHGEYYGGFKTVESAVNSLTNWELLRILTDYEIDELEISDE